MHLHIRFCSQMMSVIQQLTLLPLHLTSIFTRLISLTVTEGNKHLITRKHSSRMRTVRCSGRRWRGCLLPGGCLPGGWGVSSQGGVCLGGVCLGGLCPGVSAQWDVCWGVSARGGVSQYALGRPPCKEND